MQSRGSGEYRTIWGISQEEVDRRSKTIIDGELNSSLIDEDGNIIENTKIPVKSLITKYFDKEKDPNKNIKSLNNVPKAREDRLNSSGEKVEDYPGTPGVYSPIGTKPEGIFQGTPDGSTEELEDETNIDYRPTKK